MACKSFYHSTLHDGIDYGKKAYDFSPCSLGLFTASGRTSALMERGVQGRTGLVARAECKHHDPGMDHPEQPARFDAVIDRLSETGLSQDMAPLATRRASREEILLCHVEPYFDVVQQDVTFGAPTLRTGDTDISPASLDVALYTVGGVLNAVDAVMEKEVRNAFCVVRPPGHHACPARGMGFCIFNNIAIAARYAQDRHGISRVLVADWDVHHGNGTQDTFYEDGSVFFFGTHQHPWYPGTGAASERGYGDGEGATRNCPFPAGAGRGEIVGAFSDVLTEAADAFRPELVLVSAGFDSRRGDPLGGFELMDDDFAELTRICLDIARRHAGGRLVSVLEGGYNLLGLAAAAAAHAGELVAGGRD